ncbi:MAG: hypothetical protein EOO08_15205 [Chitinophagaceae bacterium]|nr:MAG: hypothetical protein EOO08_15205 [Chitinophagaceae bacterium]
MRLLGCLLLLLGMVACSDEPKKDTPVATGSDVSGFSYDAFANTFPKASLPYAVADSVLEKGSDTAQIHQPGFAALLPDSLSQSLFGGKPAYWPLARLDDVQNAACFVVYAVGGGREAVLLYRFEQKKFSAVIPLLLLDKDGATAQVTTIDKSGTITCSISKKLPKEQTAEGKEVYVYNAELKSFTLIGNDPLEDDQDVLNPIDTLSRKHALAGDYVKNDRNFVSIRDARNPSEINFFVHFEKGEEDLCVGELKGTALLTSSTTAVYRQGGDPCVLELTFSGNTVMLREMEGCGSRRGVQCVFEGSFTRKKVAATGGAKNVQKKKAKK